MTFRASMSMVARNSFGTGRAAVIQRQAAAIRFAVCERICIWNLYQPSAFSRAGGMASVTVSSGYLVRDFE